MGKQKPNTLHKEGKILRRNLCSKVPFGSESETSSAIKRLPDSFSVFIMLLPTPKPYWFFLINVPIEELEGPLGMQSIHVEM